MSLARAAQRNRKPFAAGTVQNNQLLTRPYKPTLNLANEWPEVFERRMMPRQPTGKWDRGPDEEEVTIFKDPRPDLAEEEPEESFWWAWLLASAWDVSKDLANTLHGFRCQGTRLVKGENSFLMKPEVSERAWINQEEYQQARDKYLVPHQKQLVKLLRSLSH